MSTKRLDTGELRVLLDFLGELYAFQDLDGFTALVNARLPELVPCDVVGYNEVNPPRRRINYVVEQLRR